MVNKILISNNEYGFTKQGEFQSDPCLKPAKKIRKQTWLKSGS